MMAAMLNRREPASRSSPTSMPIPARRRSCERRVPVDRRRRHGGGGPLGQPKPGERSAFEQLAATIEPTLVESIEALPRLLEDVAVSRSAETTVDSTPPSRGRFASRPAGSTADPVDSRAVRSSPG
jgi:hypothetical protein